MDWFGIVTVLLIVFLVLMASVCLDDYLRERFEEKNEKSDLDEKLCEACSGRRFILWGFLPDMCPACRGTGFIKQDLPKEKNDDENQQ